MEPNEQPPLPMLSSLEPDTFAVVCGHLAHREVAALASSCAALRHAVATNDCLWASLFSSQFPLPWQRLTAERQGQAGPSQLSGRGGSSSGGVLPGGWRDQFLHTHTACQQLRSTDPACREWTTDATPVHLAAICGSGAQRLTLAAQGSTVELRCASPATKSFQLYGHSARVSCAAVLRAGGAGGGAGGAGGAVQRLGIITGSHDQTVRLWVANADPESWEFHAQSLSLLTPLRTLRGHQESVTSLQLLGGSTGVMIAATGGKDRVVRLWGLAPLVPSPVQKPQIATLRGHGAPVTCLATCGGGGNDSSWDWDGDGGGYCSSGGSGGGWLMSGSLDARVKSWDPWTASATGTAKCAAPVAGMAPATAAPLLQPHTLFISSGSGVQLLDARCMRVVGGVALAQPAELRCFAQWGWDLAVGGTDGARVFDLRVLSSLAEEKPSAPGTAATAAGGGSGNTAGRGLPERLRLVEGPTRPVTSIHVDRHKFITATERYGEAPLRVWCANTGDCLEELDSCLPPVERAVVQEGEGAQERGPGASAGDEAGDAAVALGQQEGAHGALQEQELEHHHRHRLYQRHWEGVTALACRGALLVTGNSGGSVCERDWGHGGLPGREGELDGIAAERGGKFWQHT